MKNNIWEKTMLHVNKHDYSVLEKRLQSIEKRLEKSKNYSRFAGKIAFFAILFVFFLWCGNLIADILPSLNDLHVFSANTPAKASEINDNFETIRNSIYNISSDIDDISGEIEEVSSDVTSLNSITSSKLSNSGTNTYTGTLTVTQTINASGALQVGGGSNISKIQTGSVVQEATGGCDGTYNGTVTFPSPFSSTPLVFLTVSDVNGCTGARVQSRDANSFAWYSYLPKDGGSVQNCHCDRIDWVAIGQ